MGADKLYAINKEGELQRCEAETAVDLITRDFNNDSTSSSEVHSTKEAPTPLQTETVEKKVVEKITVPKATVVTDRAVYRSYFVTIGRTNLVLFILGGAMHGFTLRFPGWFPSSCAC